MSKTLLLTAAGLATAFAAAAAAEEYRTYCEYTGPADASFTGTCIESWDGDLHTVRAGKYHIRIVNQDRQGQWTRILFDGKPGMQYEINRQTEVLAPADLSADLRLCGTGTCP